jgi:hypothetical protein
VPPQPQGQQRQQKKQQKQQQQEGMELARQHGPPELPPRPASPIEEILLRTFDSEGDSLDAGDEKAAAGGGGGMTAGKAGAAAAVVGFVGGIALLLGGGYVFRGPIRAFLTFFIDAVDEWGAWGYVAYALVYTGLEVRACAGRVAGGALPGAGRSRVG